MAVVQSNMIVRRETVNNNLQGYLSVLNDYVNASENTLNSELETASQPFWDSIDVLTIKAAENGKILHHCSRIFIF